MTILIGEWGERWSDLFSEAAIICCVENIRLCAVGAHASQR